MQWAGSRQGTFMARKGASRIGFFIILGLLFVGLIGFGSTNLTGTRSTLAQVGDEEVSVQDFANALNQQLRSFEATLGQPLTMEQARAFGLDQAVLARLVTEAALDDEAAGIGLSVGDAEVRDRVLGFREFQGLDGQFDREVYGDMLDRIGLSEGQFEDQVRDESARSLLQAAVVGAVAEPGTYAETIAAWTGERRTPTWLRLGPDDLAEPVPEPAEDALRAWLEANPDDFTTPELRRITYAWLTPEMLAEEIEVPEADLRAAYEQRIDQYVQPERRLAEQLVFPDETAAEAAMAALEDGSTQFEALVTGRGLRMSDVDLGDVSQADLGAAGEAVFAAEPGDVVGPLPTSLGPALFRMNAVLAAQEIPFEEAAPDLRAELAAERARRQIDTETQGLADLIAGGATIEDLAENSALELGQIDWSEGATGGIADYDGFRAAAAAAEEGAFPELVELADGGAFALRLDELVPPEPVPFEEARDALAEAVRSEATRQAVTNRAEEVAATVRETNAFPPEREPQTAENLTRRDFVEDAPEGFVPALFEMDEGEVRVIPAADGAVVMRLDAIAPADPEGEAMTAERRTIAERVSQGIAEDIYVAYANAIQQATEIQIDDAAMNSVLSQLN